MKRIKTTKEVYQFTCSEVLKALGLKIPKSKEILINLSTDIDSAEDLLEIEVFN